MQFLELGRRTRRRVRLEELLLLLIRIGVISLLVFAFARPWGKGGVFARLSEAVRRDIVFVVDGSYSMGWEGSRETPHAAARQWVHKAVDSLHSADTVSLLDARDQVVPVIESPTTDPRIVRTELDELPAPRGSSRMAAAATRAVQLLSKTTNPIREVVLLTDGQAYPWLAEDASLWARFDDLCLQQSVKPRIWAVDVSGNKPGDRTNFSVDRIQLSRPMTVPEFPLRIRTTIRQSGGTSARRTVSLAVNGQRLQDKTTIISLPPNGEAPVEFEHQFQSPGSFLVTVSIESDQLPGDNETHAAVVVSPAVPVLLVDGLPHLDPVRGKAFFAQSALSPSGNDSPWVNATTIPAASLDAEALKGKDVVILLDVAALQPAQTEALRSYVSQGGGLILAPGAQAQPAFYNDALWQEGKGLSPARLGARLRETEGDGKPVLLNADSFEVPWMARFKPGAGVDLAEARFSQWWKLEPLADKAPTQETSAVHATAAAPRVGDTIVAGRLKTGDSWIVSRRYGEGQVAVLGAPIDSEWSTLPTKNDFVPFLHELVFSMVSRGGNRNVDIGMPLSVPLPEGTTAASIEFIDPDGRDVPAQPGGDERHPVAQLASAPVPGVYRAVRKSGPQDAPEYFVVEFDRHEADLTPMSDEQRKRISGDNRVQFISTVEELEAAALADAPRSELWWLLMLLVLGLLVFEVAMTRKLIRGGHETVDVEAGTGDESTVFSPGRSA
jgi:hypothetical protein